MYDASTTRFGAGMAYSQSSSTFGHIDAGGFSASVVSVSTGLTPGAAVAASDIAWAQLSYEALADA